MSTPTPTDEILIDTSLLKKAFKETWRKRWLGDILGFIVLAAALLFLLPQSFESEASVTLQDTGSSAGSSMLALATGGGASKRYIGFLESRACADDVSAKVGIRQIYGFPSQHYAALFMMKRIDAVDDPLTGLLDITVTLPGPSALSPHGKRRKKLIAQTAADAANDYVDDLRSYYINNDNDRESVLVRDADAASAQARADYEIALQRINDFQASLGRIDPRSLPTPSQSTASSPEAQELSTLYGDLTRVQGELAALQSAYATQKQLASGSLANLNAVPSEDPLLQYARSQVNADKIQLANLQVTYGPDHPSVILAQNKLAADERTLEAQMKGVVNDQTTEQQRNEAEIQSLVAQEHLLKLQIKTAARRLRTNRDLSSVLSRLETELQIRLQVLETTLTETAKVKLDNASAESKVSTIDTAEPADGGKPGRMLLLAAAAALLVAVYVGQSLSAYLKLNRAAAPAGSPNSLHSIHDEAPQERTLPTGAAH